MPITQNRLSIGNTTQSAIYHGDVAQSPQHMMRLEAYSKRHVMKGREANIAITEKTLTTGFKRSENCQKILSVVVIAGTANKLGVHCASYRIPSIAYRHLSLLRPMNRDVQSIMNDCFKLSPNHFITLSRHNLRAIRLQPRVVKPSVGREANLRLQILCRPAVELESNGRSKQSNFCRGFNSPLVVNASKKLGKPLNSPCLFSYATWTRICGTNRAVWSLLTGTRRLDSQLVRDILGEVLLSERVPVGC